MTTGIDSYIREQFGVADVDVRTYSPLTLAYIGDGIFDLVIRSVVVGKGNGVVARGLQRAELLAQLLRLGQHGHVVVGA